MKIVRHRNGSMTAIFDGTPHSEMTSNKPATTNTENAKMETQKIELIEAENTKVEQAKSEKPKQGRPKNPLTPEKKNRQKKPPQIGTRCSEASWLYVKNLGVSHRRVQTKTMSELYSEVILRFLIEKPWLDPKWDYKAEKGPIGTSFFKKAPSPITLNSKELEKLNESEEIAKKAATLGSRRTDSTPKDVILRTMDLSSVIGPSGRRISAEVLLKVFRNAVELLKKEKSNVYIGKEPLPLYWAEQRKKDLATGKEIIAEAQLSDATVGFSIINWIETELYPESLPVTRYLPAKMFTEESRLSDDIIFGSEGINLYPEEESENK